MSLKPFLSLLASIAIASHSSAIGITIGGDSFTQVASYGPDNIADPGEIAIHSHEDGAPSPWLDTIAIDEYGGHASANPAFDDYASGALYHLGSAQLELSGAGIFDSVSVLSEFVFTPLQDIDYQLNGSFDWSADASAGDVRGSMVATLYHIGEVENLYRQALERTVENGVVEEVQLTLNDEGPDYYSMTGELNAGFSYKFLGLVSLQGEGTGDGVGNISLQLGEARTTRVPDSGGTLPLALAGLLTLWAARRCRC